MLDKPLTQRLHEARGGGSPLGMSLHPQNFGMVAPVAQPPPIPTVPDQRSNLTEESLYDQLVNLPVETEKDRQMRSELLGPLFEAETAALEFIEAVRTKRLANLETTLEDFRDAGREQQAKVNAMEESRQQLQMAFANLLGKKESLMSALHELSDAPISRWASKSQRAAREQKIEAGKERVRKINAEIAEATTEHNAAAQALEPERARMKEISDAEIRCRGELSGQVYRDPSTMLPIFPAK
jgi:chromosome segregation ATPase